ncbi:hypothetical protein Tco_1304498 [Tanacetum coccineum]
MISTTNTPYLSRKIRRIRACTHKRPQRKEDQYAISREDQYAVLDIWHVNILEDIKHGPYSKKLQYAVSNPLDTPSYLDKFMIVFIDDILIYSKTQEEHLKEVQFLGHVINGNGIHVDPSKIEAVKNWKASRTPSERRWIELFSDYDFEILYHNGKANVVADAIRLQKGLDEMIEQRSDGTLYYLGRIWVPLKGDVRTLIMDEVYKSKYSIHPVVDKMYYDLRDRLRLSNKGHLACSSNLRFPDGNRKE